MFDVFSFIIPPFSGKNQILKLQNHNNNDNNNNINKVAIKSIQSIISSYKYQYHKMTATDDEIEEKLLNNEMILSLCESAEEAFDFSSAEILEYTTLLKWEKGMDSVASELNQLTNKNILLSVYAFILKIAAIKSLDPLQMATFQSFSNAIMDSLIKLQPQTEAITSLIDEITDIHLDFIEKFQALIDDGGEEG